MCFSLTKKNKNSPSVLGLNSLCEPATACQLCEDLYWGHYCLSLYDASSSDFASPLLFQQLGLYSGTLFVTLMSVDRYFAIVHAVAAQRARTLRYGIAASITVWVVSVSLAIPEVVFASLVIIDNSSECQQQYPDEQLQFWKMLRNFRENTVGLFVSLPIMIYCYVKILVVLSRCRNSKKSRAVKLIFTIVCAFVVCWVPYNVIVFLDTLQQLNILNSCEVFKNIESATVIAEIIALSHCCINPIIYAFIGEKFRNSLCNVLNRFLCCSQRRPIVSLRDTSEKDTSNTGLRSDY